MIKPTLMTLALITLAACKDITTPEPQTVTNGLRPDGYADVQTIEGSHANKTVILSIDALNANSGAYSAYVGSTMYTGDIYYSGAGRFDIFEDGGREAWSAFVSNSMIQLHAGDYGTFYITL